MAKAATPAKPLPQPYEPDSNDIVADMLGVVRELWPELPPEKLRQAEAQIRERWGGDRPYISRRPGQGHSTRNEAIRRDHRNGAHIPLLMRRYGLSRPRLYEIINEGA